MNNKQIIRTIIWNIISVIGSAISLLIIENHIGENMPNFWLYVPVILLIVLVVVLIVCFYINTLIYIINSNDIATNDEDNCEICTYNNSICCGNMTFEHIKKNYMLIPTNMFKEQLFRKYSLMYQLDIIEGVEKCFYSNGGKEVWVVSSNLGTELADEAVDFVADNLEHGIIYKEFYAQKDHDGNISVTATNNAKKLKAMYNNSQNLNLITYDKEISLEGFIFEMYGIVIYHYTDDHYEMYYSVRGIGSRPIYYKAPECMADKYNYILAKIYEQST